MMICFCFLFFWGGRQDGTNRDFPVGPMLCANHVHALAILLRGFVVMVAKPFDGAALQLKHLRTASRIVFGHRTALARVGTTLHRAHAYCNAGAHFGQRQSIIPLHHGHMQP